MNSKMLIVLFVSLTLILCSAVCAEDLQTTDSGVVNGGVYSHSVQQPAYSAQNSGDNEATVQFNITKEERTYNNVNTAPSTSEEKHVKNVSDAVLSTMVYVQGTDNAKSSYVNISLDGDDDGVYETVLENNRLLNVSSSGDGQVHRVNENITRVYSDYLLNYDISDYIKSDSIKVNVHATSAAGNSDSKIKYVAVVAAYNVEDSNEEYYYAINTGHSWNSYGDIATTRFNFPANATTNVTQAVLTQVATSSGKATTKLNGKEYETVTPSNYYSENTWDVTDNIQASNVLTNTGESGSYKTTLATLTIRKAIAGDEPTPIGEFAIANISIASDNGYTSNDTLLMDANNTITFTMENIEALQADEYTVTATVGTKVITVTKAPSESGSITVTDYMPTTEDDVSYSLEFVPVSPNNLDGFTFTGSFSVLNNTTEDDPTLPDDGNLGVERIDITSVDGYTSHDTLLLNSNNNVVFTIRHLEKLTGEKYEVTATVGSKTEYKGDGDTIDFRTVSVSNVNPQSEGTVSYSIEFSDIIGDDSKTITGTLNVAKQEEPVAEDLINVTNVKVSSNSNNFLVKQINNISVSLSSPEDHSPVTVTLKVDGDEISQSVSQPSGTSNIIFEYRPTTDGTKNVEVDITYENGTTETAYTGTLTAYYNGYSSKSYNYDENFTVTRQYTGKYTPVIITTFGYKSGGFGNFTYDLNLADYGITDGSKIVEVLYYQGYNWDNGYAVDQLNVKLGNQALTPIVNYNDTKGFGGWDYPSGLIVYNATGKFNYDEQTTLSFTKDVNTQVALYGGYFIVIYENATDSSNIQINEFTDLLAAGGSCYGANNTTALIYSTNDITTENLKTVKIYAISAAANEATGSMTYVNDQAYSSMNKDYNSTSQVSFTEIDPTDIVNGQNVIALQSLNDNLAAFSTIVYATYEVPANVVVDSVAITSNSGNLLANEDNTVKVNISNAGTATSATLNINIDDTTTTTELTDFTGTQTIDITYIPQTNGEKPVTITITYPDETTQTIYEGTITAYYNGYMGKSFTNGENFTTQRTYNGPNTLIINPFEYYKSTNWEEFTQEYDAAANGITDQDKIVEALYYQGYNWNNKNLAIGININNIEANILANYSDTKGFANYNYPSGLIVYNLTTGFKANQTNTITITPQENNGNVLYGGYLIIIYANNTDQTTIMINEEADLLNPESNGFGANTTTTLAYSNYNNIQATPDATLYTIAAAADKAGDSIVTLNGKEYASLADNYNTASRISIVSMNVDNLVDGENLVVLQSTNDNLFAMGTILVVTKTVEPVLVVDPIVATVGDTINLTARLMVDDATMDISLGKVVFKVNGKTVKDENGKVIYAKVVNGVATIENFVVPDSWADSELSIKATYTGSSKVARIDSEVSTITVTSKEVTMTTNDVEATAGSTVTLEATLSDSSVNTGKIIFKINGKTVKDENGKVIYAKVVNGQATMDYTIPENYKAKDYTITAVYMPSSGDRVTAEATLTVVKEES